MSQESVSKELLNYKKAIDQGTTTPEEVLEKLHKTCFAKPKVSDSEFLDVCRKYDPNFAPVSSAKERKARAALTERVHQELLTAQLRKYYEIHPDLKVPNEKMIDRHQRILFRGLDLPEQQKLLNLITGGDKRAMGDYFYERLLSKRDDLLAMLDMNDEQLVQNYFKFKDELDLVREMENYRDGCEFTEEQNQAFYTLFSKQGALAELISRIDVIASPYYANFHCENLEMSAEDASLLNLDLMGLAALHGEPLAGANGIQMGGPTYEFAQEFLALRSYTLTALDQMVSNYVASYGAHKDKCVWAGADGKLGIFSAIIDTLNDHDLIFVDIPGEGVKALHNTGIGYKNCKPEEATPDVIYQHMLRDAEKGLKSIEAANPFFLSVFTGSDQYKQLEARFKAVKAVVPTMKPPVSEEVYQKNAADIKALAESARTYLQYKIDQGRDLENGIPVGKSAKERERIEAAVQALKTCDRLAFQFKYQFSAKLASDELQVQQKQKLEKIYKSTNRNVKAPATASHTDAELCKTSLDELKAKAEPYKAIFAGQPSSAGGAMETLSKETPEVILQLAKFAGRNFRMSEGYAKQAREGMAKIVLFDYVLRERVLNKQTGETVTAGTVETALNNGFSASVLANSPAFKDAIGKVTPARIESFLNNEESRKKLFDTSVQNALAAVKTNAAGNQPLQQQPKIEVAQPKPEPQSMVNGGPRG